MKEIYKNLFIGSEQDYESRVKGMSGWAVIHACKEPYHRSLLGYKGRGAPKHHPEYLCARRNARLFLNLVDAHSPDYIPKEIIDTALAFIDESLCAGKSCLVHCNLGESRSPSIGLLYLVSKGLLPRESLHASEIQFKKIYPKYRPSPGIKGFINKHWHDYSNRKST